MSIKPTFQQSTHLTQFNNQLVDFIQKVRGVLPESHPHHKLLGKYYKCYRKYVEPVDRRVDFIEEFVTYISKYSKEISICDEGLFSEEESYYPNKHIQLLKGIDFKPLWKSPEMTDKTKEGIWKYLQTLYVIGTYVMKEHNRFKDLLKKQKQIISDMRQTLELEKKIKDDAIRQNEAEKKKASANGFNLDGLKDLFGENNLISEMAMEIAKELDLPADQLNDPLQAIKVLFGHDGSKLQEIIEKVGHKLSEKISNGLISEDKLVSDAKMMNDTLMSKFKNIPGLPDIEKFSKKIADQISKDMENKRAQKGANGEPHKPTIDELTEHLKSNLSEMGLDNMEQFQNTFKDLMSGIQSTTLPQNEEEPVPNLVNEDELDRELAELKKNIS